MNLQPLSPADRSVLEIADIVGYGHLVALLRAVWQRRLQKQYGLTAEGAEVATNMPPYPQEWVEAWLREGR